MNKQLSPMFPPETPPVRKGVYAVTSDGLEEAFAYWNGKEFGYRCWAHLYGNEQEAINYAFVLRKNYTCLAKFASWCGLAYDPVALPNSLMPAAKETD